jgi:hypothetical protein
MQSNFDSILNGVIQRLLVEYESSNFKALLEGYKRETKRRTDPLCLREVESNLVSAAVVSFGVINVLELANRLLDLLGS